MWKFSWAALAVGGGLLAATGIKANTLDLSDAAKLLELGKRGYPIMERAAASATGLDPKLAWCMGDIGLISNDVGQAISETVDLTLISYSMASKDDERIVNDRLTERIDDIVEARLPGLRNIVKGAAARCADNAIVTATAQQLTDWIDEAVAEIKALDKRLQAR